MFHTPKPMVRVRYIIANIKKQAMQRWWDNSQRILATQTVNSGNRSTAQSQKHYKRIGTIIIFAEDRKKCTFACMIIYCLNI